MTIRLGMLNLWMFGGRDHRQRQVERLAEADLDLLLVQEVSLSRVPGLATALGFDWWRCSLGPDIRDRRIGVAVMGHTPIQPLEQHQLAAAEFVNDDVYPELGRWFNERHLALDVDDGDGHRLRVGVFHATPGTSDGPGTSAGRLGVGKRKPWFHTRLAEWIATWEAPYLFGIDANTPSHDALDLVQSRFHIPVSADGGPGEDRLLGPPGTVLHDATDLWREWLASPAGALDLAALTDGEPLARSYMTKNGSWFRYDQIWASEQVRPIEMSYDHDPSVSDHALVTATIELTSQLRAAAPTAGLHGERLLDIDDFVEALGNRRRFEEALPDLRDYWARRCALIAEAFGIAALLNPSDPVHWGFGGVSWILEAAALGSVTSPSPFSGVIEASTETVELYERFSPAIHNLEDANRRVHQAVARACLEKLFPGIADRTCPETVLIQGGIATAPPDPSDFD